MNEKGNAGKAWCEINLENSKRLWDNHIPTFYKNHKKNEIILLVIFISYLNQSLEGFYPGTSEFRKHIFLGMWTTISHLPSQSSMHVKISFNFDSFENI